MRNFIYLLISLIVILNSCSKEEKTISVIKETRQDLEIIAAYEEAYDALEVGQYNFAAKKFLEAELLFPQSDWAPRSALLASYSYYLQNYYAEALANLKRYVKTYPSHKDLVYANYLIAMCYYETIEDEKRDIGPIINAGGRLNNSNYGVELLSTDDLDIIKDRSNKLIKLNEMRKLIEQNILNEIDFEKIKNENKNVIIYYKKNLI